MSGFGGDLEIREIPTTSRAVDGNILVIVMVSINGSRPLNMEMARTLRRAGVAGTLLGLLLILPTGEPAAQQQDLRQLMLRIEQLERQLGTVQSDMEFKAKQSALALKPGEKIPPTAAARLELRVNQIEAQMRGMNGRLEEIDFALQQIKSRFDTLVSDIDQRFADSQGGGGVQPAMGTTGGGSPGPSSPPPATAGSTGQMPPPGGGGQGAPGTDLASLPEGSVEDQYRHARAFLVQGAYDQAESALRAFIQTHPRHKLAGNAQYWLGETFYVRKRYEDAVVAYLEGYQKFPESQKAPDNLLKLGMSLANLGKKAEACTTFTQLRQNYPKARSTIRQTAASQRKKLGC